jgi:hypothetical protein
MDYLTKYYKNLSEQLQERVNILEAFVNRPTSTILNDTFRDDEDQDLRLLQRSQVMSHLHALTSFDGVDHATKLSAAKILQDMESTTIQPSSKYPPPVPGVDAGRDDLRRALKALKTHGSSAAFKAHAAKNLSGYTETGTRDEVVGTNDMNMRTVRRVNYDVGTGVDALAKETFGDDPVSVGGLQRSSRAIADAMGTATTPRSIPKITSMTGSVRDFMQNMQNSEVINALGKLATYSDDPGTVEGAGQSVAAQFPARFERTVLSQYFNKGGERRVNKK